MALVPFALGRDGRVYVDAVIADRVRATLLVDTGSHYSYLSGAVADRLGLPAAPVPHSDTGLRSVTPRMTVGGRFSLRDVAFVLQRPDQLPQCPITGRGVDGVLGSDLLQRTALLLDFRARRLAVWYPGGLTVPEVEAYHLKIVHTIPIAPHRTDRGVWVAHVLLTGSRGTAEEDMMIDTGAAVSTVSHAAAARLGLSAHAAGNAILSGNRAAPVGTDRVSRMRAGDLTLTGPQVFFTGRDSPQFPISLGMDVLRGYTPLIDYGRRVVYLVVPSGRGAEKR